MSDGVNDEGLDSFDFSRKTHGTNVDPGVAVRVERRSLLVGW